jgi:hypothetical protein
MSNMLYFQATLHARSSEVTPGISLELRGARLPTLIVPLAALAHSFAMSFEVAAKALESLERMFVEPDGSFVWVSSNTPADDATEHWQLDGNLFDRNGRLLLVDLKGSCSEEEFDRLLVVFGWPSTAIMFQLSREAVFLDEAAFRSYARRTDSKPI